MPWKGEKNPYKIWLSEIILQQTRVEQGWNYYEKFITAFPTIHHLAQAPEQQVFKLWEGLGYYTRCKNLIITAKYISKELDGHFPTTYESILALKGVGPYTAAAIASFAYELPYAVVDGNVFRVLSRYFAIATPIDSAQGKKQFTELANEVLDKKEPASHNQAIMDFGAVVCKPQQPLCLECMLNKQCSAFISNGIDDFPVKEKKIIKKDRWFNYIIFTNENEVLVRLRKEKDIWENLYEFFLYETDKLWPANSVNCTLLVNKQFSLKSAVVKKISKEFKQQLSHQTIHGRFIQIELSKAEHNVLKKGCNAVKWKELKNYAFPKMIVEYLTKCN